MVANFSNALSDFAGSNGIKQKVGQKFSAFFVEIGVFLKLVLFSEYGGDGLC